MQQREFERPTHPALLETLVCPSSSIFCLVEVRRGEAARTASIQPADIEHLYVLGHGSVTKTHRKGSSCLESNGNIKETQSITNIPKEESIKHREVT